jgi:hypothetical protein
MTMGENVQRLVGLRGSKDAYNIPYADVRSAQIAAMNERLQERVERIRIVGLRARDAGKTAIRDLADVVPLLLPHTAYKSYPENLLIEERWDRLTKWLATVASFPTDNVDLEGIAGIDEWIERLEQAGHYVSCTSGTTGKAAMLIASAEDMAAVKQDIMHAFSWASGIAPLGDRRTFGLAPQASVPRNKATGEGMFGGFHDKRFERFTYPVPPITIGAITRMIALRKAMAEGTARPGEIAEYERTSAERQQQVDDAVGVCAEALIAARGDKLLVSGMWAPLYKIAEEVRSRGFGGKDFDPRNGLFVAGGLKGAQLPANYREIIYETFNIEPSCNVALYGMSELNAHMPRCSEGQRYHIPPWLVCLPLDKSGDELLPIGDGEIEGRAAFFDLSMDGRWGGLITGDRIHVDFGPCECGQQSPSIRDDVVRFSDLEGDDKINCAGTIDAYVRGM